MKFPTFKRIFKTDYPPEEQALVEKLSVSVNNGFEVVYNAMSHNVSLVDNFFCTLKTVTTKVTSTGNPVSPLSFKIDTVGVIKGIGVIRVVNLTSSTVYPTSCPFISYTQDNTLITIVNITGLPIDNNFELTIIAWG